MSIKRQVLRDGVEELILQELLSGGRAPGSRLSIDGLARELDVSPTPVREAMVSLERSGLVDYVALRGYVVAPMLDAKQMAELLDARKTVETAALSRSFSHVEDLLPELERAHAHHTEVVSRLEAQGAEDFDLLSDHFHSDWAFHVVLFRHAANRYLLPMVEPLRTHTHRMRQTLESGPQALDAPIALAEHGKILQKVRENNHDGALKALSTHLDGVLRRSMDPAWAETTAGITTPSTDTPSAAK